MTRAIRAYIEALVPIADDDIALLDAMTLAFDRPKGGTLLEPGQV